MSTSDEVRPGPRLGAPPRRSRRGRNVLAGVIVTIVLLVTAVIAAEVLTRQIVTDTVRDQLRSSLALADSTPVDVEVAGPSVLLQVLSGRLDSVAATASEVSFGDLSGDARLRASGVPIRGDGTADELALTFTVADSELTDLSANLSGLPITDVQIERPGVRFSAEFEVLAFALPLSVTVTPEVVDGAIAFTPTSVSLGDQSYSAAELRRTFGSLADTALATQDFCIARYLPRAFELEAVSLGADSLTFRFGGTDVALTERELSTNGTCAG